MPKKKGIKKFIMIIYFIICLVGSVFWGFSSNAEELEEDYIEIWTPADLNLVRYDLDANYMLMADIDLSVETSEGGILDYFGYGWNPIGMNNTNENIIESFTGIFDGNGHTISGIRIRDGKYASLFAKNEGTIKNFDIDDMRITINNQNSYDSFVVCTNNGLIENISINNSEINAYASYVGSITAQNEKNGIIRRCSNKNTELINRRNAGEGGITGYNSGLIEECYNSINCNYSISGTSSSGIIKNCYSCTDNNFSWGKVQSSYSFSENSMSIILYPKGETIKGEQALNSANYVGFDFNSVWVIDNTLDYPYPQLRNNRQSTKKVVEMLDWVSKPQKLNYYNDEAVDSTGGKIKAFYADGTSEIISVTDDMISEFDSSIIGEQTLIVTYRESSITYLVSVKERANLQEIQIASDPKASEFVKGTKFDFSGAVARLFFEDKTYRDVELNTENTEGGDINTIGIQTITYSYGGMEASFEIKVIPIQITGIEISRLPHITHYIEGQTPDLTGLFVTVLRNNGTKTPIEDYTLSEISSKPGTNTVTVTYGEFSNTFNLVFAEKQLLKIDITNRPDKLNYIEGEVFDPAGMEVTAYYDNDTTEVINDYVIGSYSGIGLVSLPITYNGVTTHVSIRVTEKHAVGIRVAQKPDKTTYSIGSEFISSGMIVNLVYDSGVEEEITQYLISELPNEVGIHNLIISYEDFETSLEIEMTEPKVKNINLRHPPNKLEYIKGESFDSTGMELFVLWDNMIGQVVTDYTISGFDEIEEYGFISISYGGKSKDIRIRVHCPNDEWSITQEATCTEDGSKQLLCKYCNKVLQSDSISKTGHDYDDEIILPTCTEQGYTKHTCKNCNFIVCDTYVNANGHTLVQDDPIPRTCEEDGLSVGKHCSVCGYVHSKQEVLKAYGHNWNSGETIQYPTCTEEGMKKYTCFRCGKEKYGSLNPYGHYEKDIPAVEATCTESGLTAGKECARCKIVLVEQKTVDALGHTYSHNWIERKSPTCTEEGLRERTCSRCQQTEYEKTQPYGHIEEDLLAQNPTCEKTGLTAGKKCKRCNIIIVEQEVVQALGHDAVEVANTAKTPTCTEDGKEADQQCSRCGLIVGKTLKATGHNMEEHSSKEKTCTDSGSSAYWSCDKCNKFYADSEGKIEITKDSWIINPTGHNYIMKKTVSETCTEDGIKSHYECSSCKKLYIKENDTYTEVNLDDITIEATGHSEEPILSLDATCTEKGHTAGTKCSVCGIILKATEETVALGHDYQVVADSLVEATCTSDGKEADKKCTRCNLTISGKVIKAKGHLEEKIPSIEATCSEVGYTSGIKCTVCGEIIKAPKKIDTIDHIWNRGKITKEPTETEKGMRTYTCIECGKTKTEDIPELGKKDESTNQTTTPTDKQDDQKPSNPTNPDAGKEKSAGEGVGTISSDGTILTDTDGIKYYVSAKVKAGDLKNNLKVADKKSGGKYKITKVTKKKGKVTGGTVTYMAPYNKNCTKATAGNYIKIGGVKFKITAVNANAFKGCTKLKSFTAGENITTIGKNAFKDCKSLKTFTLKSLSLKSIGANSFKGVNAKIRFKVPKKKLDRYERMIRKAGAPKTSKITK